MKSQAKMAVLSALMLGAVSCTDLEEEIVDNFTSDAPLENAGVGSKNNVNKATPSDGLTGAFSRVLNGTANHGSYFSIQEVSTDEAVITQKGGDWFDGGIWLTMHRHQFASTGLGGINGAWNDTYGGIFQCNELLATSLSTAQRAQVRFLRAYFYWRLLDTFGRVKIVQTAGTDAPQATRLAVYNFVLNELLAVLPDLPSGRQEYGRVSQAAGHALLSRLYLNAHVYKTPPGSANIAPDNADLTQCIFHANQVINNANYSLDPNYAKVFSPDNVDNPEHIFVAPYDEATGGGMNFAQMTLHYPSQLTYQLAQQPWNGYSTLEAFYNSYAANDTRRANNFIVGPQTDVAGNPILDLAFDKADPDGAEINYTPAINQLAPNGSRQAGARLGKFSFKLKQNPDMDNDYPLLRLGEVILNKAEAEFRLGNTANALAEINKIRTRAGVPTFGSLTEGDILAERGRELFQESLRRTDLIRFNAWGNAWWEKPAHSQAFKNLFPIPNEQILASATGANPLTQNPGY